MFKNNSVSNIFSLAIAGLITGLVVTSIKTRNNIAQAQDKPQVVASHNVICDLLQTIAQDTIDLTCLIGTNQDPHTYSPTPSQRKAIEEARLIFYGGYQLEPQIINLLEATDNQIPKIALYEQVVTEPIMSEHEHEHEHSESEHEHEHEHSEEKAEAELAPDPHVWHNVENTVAMVELIQSILLQANPQEAELYLANSSALTDQLWQLDAWIDEQIATIPAGQRVLVTTHDSLNYYVQGYDLENYHTLQGLSASVSPTASQVKELSTEIKQAGVPTIFAESTQNDRVINNVARIANVELSQEKLYVDGLGQAENYTEMMTHNTCAIVNGLGGECKPLAAQN
ncbi:MAG: metal ABC transporter solute-binding protein, Zn/Mn family [Pleurocapsa sp.]